MLQENSIYSTGRWDPFSELTRLQRAINRAFDSRLGGGPGEFPPLNVSANQNEVVVTAEVPGVEPGDIDVTVQGKTFSLKGRRSPEATKDGEQFHRRERRTGEFARSLELPFILNPEKVQASLKNGILKVVLPRAEEDKPRKVEIRV